MTAAGPHLFWITSRAAGTAALVLSSTSVGAGLLIRNRNEPRKLLGGDVKALHEALSMATLIALGIHGVTLLGDGYLHPTLFEITIPFAGSYRPFWTGIGIAGGWGLAALGLSYYIRADIGQARWRSLHRFTALFWALGIAHTIGAGTDARQVWFLLVLAVPAVPALVLLLGRLIEPATERTRSPSTRRGMAAGPRRRDVVLNGRES